MSEIDRKRGFWSRLLGSGVETSGSSPEELMELLGAELAATRELADRLSAERDAAVRAGELRAQDLAEALAKAATETETVRKAARQQLAVAKREAETARLETAAAKKELQATRHELTRVRTELQASQKVVAEERVRVSRSEFELTEARGLLGRTRRQLQELEQELADVRTEAMSARGAASSARSLLQALQATVVRALLDATGPAAVIALRAALRDARADLPNVDDVLAAVVGANKVTREPKLVRLCALDAPPTEAMCASARLWATALLGLADTTDEWSASDATLMIRTERT
ncbi:MAG: hypothetical protein ACXVEE_18825 [Polyangiales bacterium]